MQQGFGNDIRVLLNRVAEGDEQAFQAVFEQYKERFYVSAFKMTHSEDRAQEIVQEVFVSIWVKRKLIALAEEPENYLYTILRNSIYAHFRKIVQERRQKMKAPLEEVTEDSVETLLIEKEERSILDSVISRLPPQQKLVYQLAKQDGMSREEIARQLNISPNTVRNHLSAAIDSLRALLKSNKSALGWFIFFLSLIFEEVI